MSYSCTEALANYVYLFEEFQPLSEALYATENYPTLPKALPSVVLPIKSPVALLSGEVDIVR